MRTFNQLLIIFYCFIVLASCATNAPLVWRYEIEGDYVPNFSHLIDINDSSTVLKFSKSTEFSQDKLYSIHSQFVPRFPWSKVGYCKTYLLRGDKELLKIKGNVTAYWLDSAIVLLTLKSIHIFDKTNQSFIDLGSRTSNWYYLGSSKESIYFDIFTGDQKHEIIQNRENHSIVSIGLDGIKTLSLQPDTIYQFYNSDVKIFFENLQSDYLVSNNGWKMRARNPITPSSMTFQDGDTTFVIIDNKKLIKMVNGSIDLIYTIKNDLKELVKIENILIRNGYLYIKYLKSFDKSFGEKKFAMSENGLSISKDVWSLPYSVIARINLKTEELLYPRILLY
jgi:hypothetical protein